MFESSENQLNSMLKVASFYVNGSAYGIDILRIQEVNKIIALTPVPGGPLPCEGDSESSGADRHGH